jgi:four helix bundle protein
MKVIKDFTDLNSWREAHSLVIMIYKITNKFPSNEKFRLTDQLCRASISITSNIAEGFGRYTYKEKVHFYYMASGSISELKNQILIAKDLGYIHNNEYQELDKKIILATKLIKGLIRKSKEYSSL